LRAIEREPAAASRITVNTLRDQLAENGAADAEIAILLSERVELNAMTSDALIEMIERKLKNYRIKKIIPSDELLSKVYLAFHRSNELREKFEEMEREFEESKIKVPENLKTQVAAIVKKHPDLRWEGSWWTGSQRNTSLPKSRRIFGLQNNNHCETNAYGIMLLAYCVNKGGALNWH
jgi:hypothetical protein